MPPRKEKVEKATGDAATDAVLSYLRQQNRPYSATDISANLHNKVTKAAAAKICKDLAERNEIASRASGKQIVYHALQDPALLEQCTPEHLTSLDAALRDAQAEIAELKSRHKVLTAQLATLSKAVPLAELQARNEALVEEKEGLERRIERLRMGAVGPVREGEREEIDRELKRVERVVARRKGIVREMWAVISEAVGEGKEELREELGVEI
ncbi:Tat binding protein 1-interacting [Trichodelitschia bisporula]|uniref:Tat binding protein 1-interacting n=1 Tax=Trichodelitschia bisporula TaxID=703511 RepID=A0A6G1HVW2_9PEZI|nr:Tat binding protein 1-interacting [Trichodelitschia bisporula]